MVVRVSQLGVLRVHCQWVRYRACLKVFVEGINRERGRAENVSYLEITDITWNC